MRFLLNMILEFMFQSPNESLLVELNVKYQNKQTNPASKQIYFTFLNSRLSYQEEVDVKYDISKLSRMNRAIRGIVKILRKLL